MRRRPVSALLIVALILSAGVAIMPWAFHIGGRWTPVLTWWGSGRLVAKGGREYPMFVMLYPSSHFSRLRFEGRRPTGGIQGHACLCTSPGANQYLKISGTIYGGWLSTEGSVMGLRLLEPTIVDVGQQRAGYFDVIGRWQGPELVLDEGASWSRSFRSGLRLEHASATLRWDPYWTCKSACAGVAGRPASRTD
jgi:hypothetical protein